MEAGSREHLLESLTGLKSSRRTYYSEYRQQERRLDHAITSIADISAALCNTTSGVTTLAQAVVRVAAQHFEATWAVLTLNTIPVQRWLAQRNSDGRLIHESTHLTDTGDEMVQCVLTQQTLVISDADATLTLLGAPMFLRDQLVGALAVAAQKSFVPDERELSVLQTLANQAAVALENARLYEEVCRQKSELEAKNRQLEKARHWLAVARQNEIVNNERNRIARELHDSAAQYLISIGMNLEWCRAQLRDQPQIYDRLCSAKELARSAITQMRTAIYELSTIKSGQSGLVAALRELAMDFEKTSHLRVRLQIAAGFPPLAGEVEHALYHIAQEALFNAYKHAQAKTTTLKLSHTAELVQMTVTDDGVGIGDPCPSRPTGAVGDEPIQHFGLRNMRERACEVGGDCRIGRRQRGGTEVAVKVPTSARLLKRGE